MNKRLRTLFWLTIGLFIFYIFILLTSTLLEGWFLKLLRVLLGVAIFFLVGADVTLVFEKISKVPLDFWEFSTVAALISLFFNPAILYVLFLARGSFSETFTILAYCLISVISLTSAYYYNKER